MVDYSETTAPVDDDRANVLHALAGGHPWVLITVELGPGDELGLKLESGGGIEGRDTVRSLLQKTLEVLP